MSEISAERRKQVIDRLSRIEGQVRGIRKMVEEERECQEILKQLAAANGAMRSLSLVIVENFLDTCLMGKQVDATEMKRQLLEVFNRVAT
jgi:DNA-binding FrmR family transcriptional regulator